MKDQRRHWKVRTDARRRLSTSFGFFDGFLILAAIVLWCFLPTNRLIMEEAFENVISSQENTAHLVDVMLVENRDDETYWMPEEAQILTLERQLHLRAREQLPAMAPKLPSMNENSPEFS